MRTTRLGKGVVAAGLITLLGAATSGSNLLYLVNGMVVAAALVALIAARRNLAGLSAAASAPPQIFGGAAFEVTVVLSNPRRRAARRFDVAVGGERRSCARLPGRSETALAVPAVLPRRGRHVLSGLALESAYPFGLFRFRRALAPLEVLVFPPVADSPEPRSSPAVRKECVPLPRQGVGDDFLGVRSYADGEDARLIDWKITARTGAPHVKDYAHDAGSRITITVHGRPGSSTEREIADAASAARFHIDEGAEVRLVTDEGHLDYGRGLLHLEVLLEKLALLGEGKTPREALPAEAAARPVPGAALPGALYLTVGVSLASLLLIEELSPLIVLPFFLPILLARRFDRRRRHPIPRAAFDALGILFLAFFLLVDVRGFGAHQAVIHLTLFILTYLLLLPKGERQVRQLILTSFLIFYLASGQAVSLWYFAFFLAYFLAAGACLNASAVPAAREPGRSGAPALAGLVLAAFALAVASFAFMPRLYSPRLQRFLAAAGLSRFQANERSFAGLTERVELGWLGPLRKNFGRVMQVVLPEAPQGSPPPELLRVRGGAFDAFDGRRWRRTRPDFTYESGGRRIATRHAQAWYRREGAALVSPSYDPARPSAAAEFIIFPLLNTSLAFGLGEISAIEGGPAGAFFDFTDTVSFASGYAEGTRYRVLSQSASPASYLRIEGYDRLLKEKYLSIPADTAKYAALAREFAGPAVEPLSRARAMEERLRDSFAYSLSADAGRQTLDDFLFRSRAGNCEFFATALCLLLRAEGIPSRLAIGFLAEEWNAYGRFFDVRQSDAHAWVEAFFPERGWETFDPTPSSPGAFRAPGLLARLWGTLDQAFQAVQFRWYRYVVGFDTETRRNFVFGLRSDIGSLLAGAGPAAGAVLAIGAAAVLFALPRRRKARRRRSEAAAGDSAFAALMSRLARAGFRRGPGQTGRDFAASVVRRAPELAALVPLTELRYKSRFSGRPAASAERDEVRRLERDIGAALTAFGKSSCPAGGKGLY